MSKLDILAFGVHPDDVELGAGGLMAKQSHLGSKTGIIDLTRGELGTRGTVNERNQESENASVILGLQIRENLDLKDGFFKNDVDSQLLVIKKIRQYQPDIIICNAPFDRHPDHARAADLVIEASFYSGLRKIETEQNGKKQESWRPRLILQYIQFLPIEPAIVIDVSGFMDKKMDAVLAYKSQFYNPNSNEPSTIISSKGFLDSINYRAQDFGRIIGVEHAEGFISKRILGVNRLEDLI